MKRAANFSWVAFAVGFASTLLLATLAWLGVFENLELRSVDWRYRHARSDPQPLSPEVALVVIDNESLEAFGRWPWPRHQFATALGELKRAGAKTVALDLLLSERDPTTGGDVALARAMADFRTVLGIDIASQTALGAEWRTPEGKKDLAAIIEVLSSHIDMSSLEAANQANLKGARRVSFLEEPLWFKGIAVWSLLWKEAERGPIPNLDELIFKLRGGNESSEFPERDLIEELLERAQSWRMVQEEMVRAGSHSDLIGGHDHDPPIPELAEAAAGIGVVTNEIKHNDVDGAKRRTGTAWTVPGGTCHQFGLVAAATHLGIEPDSFGVSDDRLQLGSTVIPLRRGVMILDWPTSTFGEGFAKWSQEGMTGSERAVVSIGELINLGLDVEQQRENEVLRDQARAAVSAKAPSLSTPEFAAKSAGEFAELLDSARMNDELSPEAAPEAEEFLKLFEEVQRGAADIAARSAEMQTKFKGKLVFVGWTATGALADFVPSPYDPKTPGVFVHAVAADMVIGGHSRQPTPGWAEPASILLLGGLAALCAARFGTGLSATAAIGLLGIWLWTAGRIAFNDWHAIVPLVAPALAPIVAWANGTAAVAVLASRDRARIKRQFAARVSPQLVAKLSNDPRALSVSGQEREITVMFGDLAGFTTIAEQLGGPGVVRTLNLYLGRLSAELIKRDAYVNKFLGDGFMAFWSAFGDEPRQESRAAESAVACQAVMKELAKSAEAGGVSDAPKISVRLGIATGMAVVGDCGAPPHLNDYTAIGDVVNLASRLESANKQFGTGILIDGATRRGIEAQGGNPSIKLRPLGHVVVVGQTTPIEVCEVVGADADDAWIAATARAVELFRSRKLAESGIAWRDFEAAHGPSKLSAMYLSAIAAGDGSDDGVLRLRAK